MRTVRRCSCAPVDDPLERNRPNKAGEIERYCGALVAHLHTCSHPQLSAGREYCIAGHVLWPAPATLDKVERQRDQSPSSFTRTPPLVPPGAGPGSPSPAPAKVTTRSARGVLSADARRAMEGPSGREHLWEPLENPQENPPCENAPKPSEGQDFLAFGSPSGEDQTEQHGSRLDPRLRAYRQLVRVRAPPRRPAAPPPLARPPARPRSLARIASDALLRTGNATAVAPRASLRPNGTTASSSVPRATTRPRSGLTRSRRKRSGAPCRARYAYAVPAGVGGRAAAHCMCASVASSGTASATAVCGCFPSAVHILFS